jgi:two-component system OmpR family response regulator
MTIPHLLVVDDDPDMLEMMKQYLHGHGFAVHTASTGLEVSATIARQRIDLILLDVMLGDESGITICRQLRADSAVPVIIVSALSADHHRMAGYESGADDYIAKPFNPELLLARVRAVVRRARRSPSLIYRRDNRLYRFARWHFDGRRDELTAADGVEVALSKREIGLLKVLLANPFVPLRREEIADALDVDRDSDAVLEAAEGRAIDVLVGRLRSKIEDDAKTPELIRTVRGTGYVFAAEVRVEEA